jgi:two-component system response regulator ResD
MTARILVADDEADIRLSIRLLLQSRGYHVDEARHGREALAKLEGAETPYALLILDLMMPELDGYAVLDALDEASAPPVVVLTAKGAEADKLRGFRKGARRYVTKPFHNETMLATIQEVLALGASSEVDP